MEEGSWTSPNTGRKYDLSKIVLWMTGNDLQDAYFGVTDDDMRKKIYEEIKDEQNVRRELRQRGVPEAFLGCAARCPHRAFARGLQAADRQDDRRLDGEPQSPVPRPGDLHARRVDQDDE